MDKAKLDKYLEEIWKDLEISEDNLSEAVSNQSALFLYYGLRWLKATKKVMLLKAELEEYEAKVKNELRMKEGNSGKRLTEKYLEESVLLDEGYKERLRKYIEAKEEEAFWDVVKGAFKQRKDMIEALVNLMLVSRWTEDKVRMDDFVDVVKKSLRNKLREKREKIDVE